jgi:GDP/UDP-N,N'-diacetylbacillosamine 2-epimerase (hydrolysing)
MEMNKRIAIFSTSRSDFGILAPFINAIQENPSLQPLLFVGGTHLSKQHGETISEVEEYGFEITGKFDYLTDSDERHSLSYGLGDAIKHVADIFESHEFEFVCILGDRYELLSIVVNAILFGKPIIHLNAGEVTEGAIDEVIRSMISKAAHLHFTACEKYVENVRRLGEEDWRIHNTGTLSADSMRLVPRIEKSDLFEDLGLDIEKKTVLMTYHPVTRETEISHEVQIKNLFKALNNYDFQIVITAPNADHQRSIIQSAIDEETSANRNMILVQSLGVKRFYNFIPHCEFVIGNSSSGIIAAPFFVVPTINIGNRQTGRLRHASVIDVDYSFEAINDAIRKAQSSEFRNSLKNMRYMFGDGYAAERMVTIIEKSKIDQRLIVKRRTF